MRNLPPRVPYRLPIYPSPAPQSPLGPPPSFIHDQETVGRLMEIEKESYRDDEVVRPLDHWESRRGFPNVTGSAMVFSTPIFDFWYDHLYEEGMPSGQVVNSAGGGLGFGGATGPGAGTSPQDAYKWQNHIFDYTVKLLAVGGGSFTVSAATLTIQGGMNLQSTDEPFTINTVTVTNDLAKPDSTVFVTGRVPMRFMRFQLSINMSAQSAGAAGQLACDIIQQIGVRPT